MRYLLLIGIVYVFASGQLEAQERRYLHGQLLTADSLLPMPNAHVISKYARRGTISDSHGHFSIPTKADDSLLLTSIGFEKKIVHIPDSVIDSPHRFVVFMQKDTVRMEEVVVRSFYDWETFKYLMVNMKSIEPVDLDWLHEELERSLTEIRTAPATFGGPIQALYNILNRTARLQRQMERNRRLYNLQLIRAGRINDTIPARPPHLREKE